MEKSCQQRNMVYKTIKLFESFSYVNHSSLAIIYLTNHRFLFIYLQVLIHRSNTVIYQKKNRIIYIIQLLRNSFSYSEGRT